MKPKKKKAELPPFVPSLSMERILILRDEQPEVFANLAESERHALAHYERWRATAATTQGASRVAVVEVDAAQ